MNLSSRQTSYLALALTGSAAFNLLAVGLFVGNLMHGTPEKRAVSKPFEHFVESLPDQAQPVVRKAFADHRDEVQRKMRGLQQARRNVGTALANKPYDPALLQENLAKLRDANNDIQATLHETFADAIQDLPPDVRDEVADDWKRRPNPTDLGN